MRKALTERGQGVEEPPLLSLHPEAPAEPAPCQHLHPPTHTQKDDLGPQASCSLANLRSSNTNLLSIESTQPSFMIMRPLSLVLYNLGLIRGSLAVNGSDSS